MKGHTRDRRRKVCRVHVVRIRRVLLARRHGSDQAGRLRSKLLLLGLMRRLVRRSGILQRHSTRLHPKERGGIHRRGVESVGRRRQSLHRRVARIAIRRCKIGLTSMACGRIGFSIWCIRFCVVDNVLKITEIQHLVIC
jgi:hypothetical protein